MYPYFSLESRSAAAAASAKSLQSCDSVRPHRRQPSGSSVPGILQARTLEWVAISFSNAWKFKVKEVAQLCPTLSDPTDCSPPGSSVHGIFQARVLEWGATAFFRNQGLSPLKYINIAGKNAFKWQIYRKMIWKKLNQKKMWELRKVIKYV